MTKSDAVEKTPSTRSVILATADQTISADREEQYGAPADNFAVIGEYWTVWLGKRLRGLLTAHDVAMMLTLMKVARIQTGRSKQDNYIDAAGYVALGGEIGTQSTVG